MHKLNGKIIWLIGASEGIGRALALQLAAHGAHLILTARNAERLQNLQIEMQGSQHIVLPCDVTALASVEAAWETITAQSMIPDIVIYNAGAYEPLPADQFDLTKIEQMIDINLHGALRILQQVIPVFVQRKQGHIALVGSIAGYRGLPGAMGYACSKAALINLAECLRCDLRQHNIKIQIINPGYVQTRLTVKNSFKMFMMITPEAAAAAIINGLQKNAFEICFPWLFVTLGKIFRSLPNWLYYSIMAKSQ